VRPSGDSHSAAPDTKSATTESTAMPRPEMKMPVWPVARKSASTPRARISFSIASAVYFLPTAQSVPTVSTRFPLRLRPVPGMNDCAGWRTSMSLPARFLRRCGDLRHSCERLVQARCDVKARRKRVDDRRKPNAAQ
jgi:hypothetical protein